MKLKAAWGLTEYEQAKKALEKVVQYLEGLSPAAAKSLREAFEETLTIHRLKMPKRMRQTFRSTNPIESMFSRYRDLCRNVKTWKNENMAERWAGTVLLKAEEKFRRIQGHHEIPFLLTAFESVDHVKATG